MSYITKCEKGRVCTDGRKNLLSSGAHKFNVQWRSVTGQISVNPKAGIILYRKFSRLGELLRKNHESEKYFIEKAVKAHGDEWDRELHYEWMSY